MIGHSTVSGLLLCWHNWLGNHTLDTWNLIPGCLMWIVWMEWNRCSFEDTEKTLVELKYLCQRSLFDWSQCSGFTDCSSLLEFVSSLRIASWFLFLCCLFMFSCVHHHEHLCLFPFFFSSIILLLLPIKKRKRNWNFYFWGCFMSEISEWWCLNFSLSPFLDSFDFIIFFI